MRIKKYRILHRGRAHPARSPAESAILRKGRGRDISHPYRAAGSSVTGSTSTAFAPRGAFRAKAAVPPCRRGRG